MGVTFAFQVVAVVAIASTSRAGAADVVPIDWKRFEHRAAPNDNLRLAAHPLLNAARYNLAWAPSGAAKVENEWQGFTKTDPHNFIRPVCSASAALAIVLKTGVCDERVVGVPRDEALTRTLRLIRAAARSHNRESWRYPWQSPFWAADLAQAGWMLWDQLDRETQGLLAAIVEFEADRFLASDYQVPYWNGKGGDTKAEENAWNATIHQIACAMMPKHPNAPRWKRIGCELMISAFALEEDLKSEAIVDGKPVKDWLRGYNVRADGALINHGIFHPDYMTCVNYNLNAHIVQALAGQTVPEAANFRAEFIWRTLAVKKWPSPPYQPPGGAIYVPGRAEVYYPQGTDWFKGRLAIYYNFDTWAHVLGWGKDLPIPPEKWMRLRANAIVKNQERHEDRRVYASGEFTNFPPREQSDFKSLADAYLALWLHARGVLRPR
jgi:hypothetical protein